MLLRKKAAEELKKEQERKAAERVRIIDERCGEPRDLDYANEGNVNGANILYLLFVFFSVSQHTSDNNGPNNKLGLRLVG